MPTITGIEHVSPNRNHFKYGQKNTFYFLGTGLRGMTLTRLEGMANHGGSNKPVTWSDIGTDDTTSDTKLLVHGTPARPRKAPHAPPHVTDPGDITPTLTDSGGGTFTKTTASDYGD